MLNVTFPEQLKQSEHQQEVVELFNGLIKKKPAMTSAERLKKLLSSTVNDIDHDHEIDKNIRVKLEKKFKNIPNHTIDVSALLTSGPFQGKSLLWVSCYIGASTYTFIDVNNTSTEGYSYIFGKLLDKAIPSSIQFAAEFPIKGTRVSALWLAMYAHLKTVSIDSMWIVNKILKLLSPEELIKLDFNSLSMRDDRVAVSSIALIIQSEIDVVEKFNQYHDNLNRLLKKLPPKNHPGFYNFNAPVLDANAYGMTTLCLAARGDAELIQTKTISFNSPFISILRAADLTTLNFKAKIRKGSDIGKTPLWYAAYMLEEDEDSLKHIVENVDFNQLDFNDKAEAPNDKNANKSALWFISHHYARNKSSYHLNTVFSKIDDLSNLDFNNAPTSPKDKHAGQTVLWNLGEAALSEKSKPFTRVLKLGKRINLDYSARAQHGANNNKSVLGVALALAMKGNFKALNLILQNIQTFGLKPEAIKAYELEMLCHLAKQNHLYPLDVLLPYVKMQPEYLNAEVTYDKSGKNVIFLLIQLAWQGYPHFLKLALKDIDIRMLHPQNKLRNPDDSKIVTELNSIVSNVSRYDGKEDLPKMPILQGFLDSGFEELTEQLGKLELSPTSSADIMDFKAIAIPIKQLTTQFNLNASSMNDHKKVKVTISIKPGSTKKK